MKFYEFMNMVRKYIFVFCRFKEKVVPIPESLLSKRIQTTVLLIGKILIMKKDQIALGTYPTHKNIIEIMVVISTTSFYRDKCF